MLGMVQVQSPSNTKKKKRHFFLGVSRRNIISGCFQKKLAFDYTKQIALPSVG
jgi:hypothetical protein